MCNSRYWNRIRNKIQLEDVTSIICITLPQQCLLQEMYLGQITVTSNMMTSEYYLASKRKWSYDSVQQTLRIF